MFYTYILYSYKSKNFYYGYTENLQDRFRLHNEGKVKSTAPFLPWTLVFYAAFSKENLAKEFEHYLKTGSGKALAYKRFLDTAALKKDKQAINGIPKL